ncbi:MAG: nuclear transport factor 2 family protein [Gordonia sp. (in: high G+C Gram-positive bacteria)]|uniref:nuclear transport factor 2 family protein n=1 Tax=Gordonia sp. (in: high G+C Gram-positive bacteria) TaxID=84139 RepID=UPI003C75C371
MTASAELLADLRAIETVKYRYLRAVDTKDWVALADTLTEDVVASYGSEVGGKALNYADRDSLIGFLSKAMAPTMSTEHRVNHPIIEIDGDTATGSWYLQDRVLIPDYDVLIIGAAFYSDTYRRTDDGWRISATGYERTFEARGKLSAAGLVVEQGPAIVRS